MSVALVPLALLMGLATYPFRAIPLLAPGFDRLAPPVRLYLRLVSPAILAALTAVNTVVLIDPVSGRPTVHLGAEWIAVGLCIAVVAMRRSLLIGLVLAAVLISVLRATGFASLP